jgi:hypothetical protein
MTTYYKATRVDGTSFYDSTTTWKVGRITRHPNPDTSKGLCSSGVLHISDAPAETLIGGSWPCRLFEVEPRSALISGDGHKHGCAKVKVVKELPAWMALGPNGEAVAANIERCKTITADEAERLDAAWYAAWYAAGNAAGNAARNAARNAAWDAAWDAARDAAWYAAWYAAGNAAWNAAWDAARDAARNAARNAAWNAAWDAARDAALALVVRDLITPEQFDLLYGPWASVFGVADERTEPPIQSTEADK